MVVSREEAARVILERRAARESFEGYCRHVLRPMGREPAAHHLLLIRELDALISTPNGRLIVTMPPGSAKSTYSSVLLPGYFFMRKPESLLIGASHTAALAEAFSRRAMATIRDNEAVLGYGLASEAAAGWRTDHGSEYVAVGIGGPITGKRADGFLIDDPVKSQAEAQSLTVRNTQWDWFNSDAQSRLRPGGWVALITTRWHEDDLAGRLLANAQGWKVFNLPAEAGENDPLGRAPGEFLWADDEYGYADLTRRMKDALHEAGQSQVWYALYQGSPRAADGNIFKVENLGEVDAEPAGYRWVRAWDLAASSGKGDWTVGAKIGIGPQGHLVIGDIVRLRGGPDEVERAIVATARHDGRGVEIDIPQDPGQAGKAQVAYFGRALFGYNLAPPTPETGDKVTRAMPLASQVNVGNVRLVKAHWNRVLVDEMAGFPAAKFDDQVDALSRGTARLIQRPASARMIPVNFMAR